MNDVVMERLRHLFETVKRPDGRRWTLREVAEGTGLSLSYLWKLRSGRAVNPTRQVLEKLASFFGVPVTYLMGSTEKAEPLTDRAGEQEIAGMLLAARDWVAAANPAEGERLARAALDRARALGSTPLTIRALVTLGRVLAGSGRTGEAQEAIAAALSLSDDLAPGPERVESLLALAYLEYEEGRFETAYCHAQRALAILEATRGDSMLRYETLLHVGTLAREAGHAQQAQTYLQEALPLAEALGDRYLVPVLTSLGLTALDLGRADEALEYFTQSLSLAIRLRFAAWINRAQHNTGLAYQRLGRWHDAIESLVKSLGSHEALGDIQLTVYDHAELAWCYASIGQREAALRHGYMALALAQEHEREALKARAHWYLGRVLALLGDLDEAAHHYEQAALLLEHLGSRSEMGRLRLEYGDLMAKRGDAARASELYRQAALSLLEEAPPRAREGQPYPA
ncbi:MAG TPA: tetratricopeptide repeat protein [Limnochordales bacterium]